MDEKNIEDGNCFGHYHEISSECKVCIINKDCRKERNGRVRKKKLAEPDNQDRVLTKREKDRWMAMQLIEVAKSLIESESSKANKADIFSKKPQNSCKNPVSETLDYCI